MRTIAAILAAIAIGFLGYDVAMALGGGGWRPTALGTAWFAVHPESLQLLQPAIERHLHPALWDPYVLSVLEAPAFVVFAALAGLFLLLHLAFRGRRRRTLLD